MRAFFGSVLTGMHGLRRNWAHYPFLLTLRPTVQRLKTVVGQTDESRKGDSEDMSTNIFASQSRYRMQH